MHVNLVGELLLSPTGFFNLFIKKNQQELDAMIAEGDKILEDYEQFNRN
jgi:hypothetical protein